ncbi:phostensin [Bufo gargarizans]|uniref:phostensin n=1 Tax=Bufo gargarizans TaxID=30331 RepID=UPI001CF4B350|nr:phostensin [Bufo gargarizans]
MMEVPDWKVHLLERKRKEEEETKRRDREEEERLAKMPPWKREIILRRKAKAGASISENKIESEGGEQEEKVVDGEEEEERESRVLRENIGPVQKNPFIQQEKQRRMPEYSCIRPKSTTEQTVQRIPKVDDLVRETSLPNEVKEQDAPLEVQQSSSTDVKGRVSRLLSRFGGSRSEDDGSDPCLQRVNGEGETKTVLPISLVVTQPEIQASSIANPTPPSPSCLLATTGSQTVTQETTLYSYVTSSSSCVDSELSTCAAPTAMSGFNTRKSMTEEVRPFPFQLRPASPARQLRQTTQVSPVSSKPETFKVNAGKAEEDGETGFSPSKVTGNIQTIKRVAGDSQAVQRRKGNTITVNPRKVAVCENGYASTETKSPVNKPESGKKRYPTAEEIKVTGGYLILPKSCLAKHSRDKKKMNISFPESDLESTFEYPSESSMLAEYGPADEPEVQVPPLAQPEDDEEEESALLAGILRRKALIVDESCKR